MQVIYLDGLVFHPENADERRALATLYYALGTDRECSDAREVVDGVASFESVDARD
jgi:hypothetical protein